MKDKSLISESMRNEVKTIVLNLCLVPSMESVLGNMTFKLNDVY